MSVWLHSRVTRHSMPGLQRRGSSQNAAQPRCDSLHLHAPDPGCLSRRWIEMNALKEVSAPVAAIIYSAEPLWGAGLAWGILGERCALPHK